MSFLLFPVYQADSGNSRTSYMPIKAMTSVVAVNISSAAAFWRALPSWCRRQRETGPSRWVVERTHA